MKTYYIIFTLFLLSSCGGVKEGCNYPETPRFNEDGQIDQQWQTETEKRKR